MEIKIEEGITGWEIVNWCECDNPNMKLTLGVYYCGICNYVVECEFSEDNNKCFAEVRYIDYFVCKKHLSDAISNVLDRSGI